MNSGTLMESFARVDKYRWSPERSNIATRCGACSQPQGDITLRTSAVADMIVDIVKNIDCQRYSRDQLVNVLVKLKCLAKHEQGLIIVFSLNNIRFMIDPESERCLDDKYYSRLSSSRSPYLAHLLHLTAAELSRMTSPKEEVMVSFNCPKEVATSTHCYLLSAGLCWWGSCKRRKLD